MPGTVSPASIIKYWESANDCDEFISHFRGWNVHRYIFFHPGYNLAGGHRRAVYLVENGLDSFIFYCEKPQAGRIVRGKRIMRFLSEIDAVVVYAGSERMTGGRWYYSRKYDPLSSVQLMFLEGKPLNFLVPTNRVDIPAGYSTDLSGFMERVLKILYTPAMTMNLPPGTGTGHNYNAETAQEERIKELEKKLKEMKKKEQELVESEPTNDQVAEFYLTERSQELPRETPEAPYSYNQAFRRRIPEGKRLTDYSDVSGASRAISRATERKRNTSRLLLKDQELDLPAGGRRTRRGKKRRHRNKNTRRRRRSKRR